MKTMKMKSRVAMMGLAAVMCTLAVATPAFAEPPNTDNKPLTLKLNVSTGYHDGSGWEEKVDDSSTFVWAQYMTSPCQLFVDGSNTWGGDRNNCTVNERAYLRHPGSFAILQKVNEWGYHQAELTGWIPSGSSYVSGWWSPDSYGSYPIINAGY